MDTNRLVIGNVYQIEKWKVSHYDINYSCTRIKDNALLYREDNGVFRDVETKLFYKANVDTSRQIGDAIVFSGSVTPFNPFLEEEDRCNDVSEDKIIKVYQKVKPSIKKAKD